MGNTMSCFDRWGKRTPDGALFAPKKRGGEDDRANALFSEPKATLSTTASTATPAAPAAATPAAATGGTPAAKVCRQYIDVLLTQTNTCCCGMIYNTTHMHTHVSVYIFIYLLIFTYPFLSTVHA